MRKAFIFIAISLFTGAVHAAVTVAFVQPEKYRDIGRYQGRDAPLLQKELEAHLQELGAQLPAGQNLAIEFLDIDLAGEERFFAGQGKDIRIQNGAADGPRMRVRYTLERNGKTVGYIRAASYGHTLGGAVGLGMISSEEPIDPKWIEAGTWEIEIAGTLYPALASL